MHVGHANGAWISRINSFALKGTIYLIQSNPLISVKETKVKWHSQGQRAVKGEEAARGSSLKPFTDSLLPCTPPIIKVKEGRYFFLQHPLQFG